MPESTQAILAANRAGRLGLAVYAIPNFPDPDFSTDVLRDLTGRSAVSVLETTFPVSDRYSDYANDVIRNAHRTALQHGDQGLAAIDHLTTIKKPKICVLYRATYEDSGLATVAAQTEGYVQGLLFEWEVDSDAGEADCLLSSHAIESIHAAGDYLSAGEVGKLLRTAPFKTLVYLETRTA